MSAEENKAVVRRLIDQVNEGNLGALDELATTTYVHHDPANPRVRSLEDYRHLLTRLRTAFPDAQFAVEDLIAEGDKVAARWTLRGTHKAAGRGAPATGKQVTMTGISIARIAGGKTEEVWVNTDALGLLQQLGALPAPGQASG